MSKRKGHILFVRVVPVLFSTTGDSTQIYPFLLPDANQKGNCYYTHIATLAFLMGLLLTLFFTTNF